jgi:hypothetical protein
MRHGLPPSIRFFRKKGPRCAFASRGGAAPLQTLAAKNVWHLVV